MSDLGHPLEFGTFPEPKSNPPHGALDLARKSEAWGYDFVAFQDHPYQPGYLDPLALMSYVAASTQRIRVSTNVLNTALRLPAIVAKNAATIDILSEGRVELGLGAGFYWDAVESIGGRRFTHGQSIKALEEAINIIRGTWATEADGEFRYKGQYYSVPGMQPGPRPWHPIPIWIGAYKPRMLNLTGRLGDAWTAGLGVVQTLAKWRDSSERINEAAAEAGRDPSEIRRIAGITGAFGTSNEFLQGPPEQWVEQLLPVVVEDGAGSFLVATDNEQTLGRFAAEVIPALRDAVEQERGKY
jgi:alkanesulfonate monooxygenase SsuD/methylene tetrahydromethanopterin reductase-like flavin-dependent oxidoreductase (luciferase family)